MGLGEVLLVIIGMAFVTYVPRVVPLFFLSGRQLPSQLSCWLSFVPVAILAALLCAGLEAKDGAPAFLGFDVRSLLAAIPATIVAGRYRSIVGTIAVGMIGAVAARLALP